MTGKLVTSYTDPDLDGTACIVAYTELLNKLGEKVEPAFFGEPDPEANYLLNEFNIKPPEGKEKLDKETQVILVDASFPESTPDQIRLEQVSEIIDHRKNSEADKYPNAKAQVEEVGAAATLIAEKFREKEEPVSAESATLLHAAITDNTVALKADVTTGRDRKMTEWLEKQRDIDPEISEKIFEIKSETQGTVYQNLQEDYYSTRLKDKKIGPCQLEMLEAEKYIRENKEKIEESLEKLKEKDDLDHVFLTSVDIEKGKNMIITPHPETRELISEALGTTFQKGLAERKKVKLRKQIMPKIREELDDET